eukprot:528210-Prymnesium_polylepis.1
MLCLDGVLLCERVTPPFEWRLLVRRGRAYIHLMYVYIHLVERTYTSCMWVGEHESFRRVSARQFTDRLQCFLACELCALPSVLT